MLKIIVSALRAWPRGRPAMSAVVSAAIAMDTAVHTAADNEATRMAR